jgi:hypothetical protein
MVQVDIAMHTHTFTFILLLLMLVWSACIFLVCRLPCLSCLFAIWSVSANGIGTEQPLSTSLDMIRTVLKHYRKVRPLSQEAHKSGSFLTRLLRLNRLLQYALL